MLNYIRYRRLERKISIKPLKNQPHCNQQQTDEKKTLFSIPPPNKDIYQLKPFQSFLSFLSKISSQGFLTRKEIYFLISSLLFFEREELKYYILLVVRSNNLFHEIEETK